MNGDTYFTRKGNYGFNLQLVGNVPSNLWIADYCLGMTGATHDAEAFKHTAAGKFPDWFFKGDEFAWVDSAYPCTKHTIPVHKEPPSHVHENAIFDKYVSRIWVCSEHMMGALKGRFQCLRGLRVDINSKNSHAHACRWIKCAIILHSLVIDVEGSHSAHYFRDLHTSVQEQQDCAEPEHVDDEGVVADGEEK
ncbi:hypothetical protein H0H81_004194 [Sphagnurus paluster]|uniref:DDE Tnp4 domain-containing protein n=1 Tax=Sphagnurus paluster TaxID=117069 RepID=A0A9P7KI55_9AGAR|nr:hypothetical protein H0H81_004194 [Sphagnurus paluster]